MPRIVVEDCAIARGRGTVYCMSNTQNSVIAKGRREDREVESGACNNLAYQHQTGRLIPQAPSVWIQPVPIGSLSRAEKTRDYWAKDPKAGGTSH